MIHKFTEHFHDFKLAYNIYGTTTIRDKYGNERLNRDETPKGSIIVMWSPITDEISMQQYGADIDKMLQCVLYDTEQAGETPEEHDRLKIKEDWYEIISIKPFNTHKTIKIKKLVRNE